MRKGKNRSKKSNAAKGLEVCSKVVAVIIREYTEIALDLGYDWKEISAFAEAAARLGQIARDKEHLTSIQSRPARRATAVLYRQRGMLPRLRRLESTAALKGEGPGDNAGVRGPACDGCGHVDRLIT